MGTTANTAQREPWNKGKIVGQKATASESLRLPARQRCVRCSKLSFSHSRARERVAHMNVRGVEQTPLTGKTMSESNISDKLLVEEFIRLHEHVRQAEVGMNQLVNWIVTGSATVLAAATAFVLQASSNEHATLSTAHCYLFLAPMPFLICGFAMLATQKRDIYKVGYYINVFFEEKIGGAQWVVRLTRYRGLVKGESQDAVTLIMWALFFLASTLFYLSLLLAKAEIGINSLPIIVLTAGMIFQHRRFTRDQSEIRDAWLTVARGESEMSNPKRVT